MFYAFGARLRPVWGGGNNQGVICLLSFQEVIKLTAVKCCEEQEYIQIRCTASFTIRINGFAPGSHFMVLYVIYCVSV